ncbi:hypothetical protein ACR3I8_05635 [Priestia flexa]
MELLAKVLIGLCGLFMVIGLIYLLFFHELVREEKSENLFSFL